MVIIWYFEDAVEIAALPSGSSNPMYTLVCGPMCCGTPITTTHGRIDEGILLI
jgi:hypothetical protein